MRLQALALVAVLVAIPRPGFAIDYLYPFLDASENQASEGVRRYDASNVLMACSYTLSGTLPQGMW